MICISSNNVRHLVTRLQRKEILCSPKVWNCSGAYATSYVGAGFTSQGQSRWGLKLITHLDLAPKLRKSGVILVCPHIPSTGNMYTRRNGCHRAGGVTDRYAVTELAVSGSVNFISNFRLQLHALFLTTLLERTKNTIILDLNFSRRLYSVLQSSER